MNIQITPLTEDTIPGFHHVLEEIVREQKYLPITEAPPLDTLRTQLLEQLRHHLQHFVAMVDGVVVGWIDIKPKLSLPYRHVGTLGMGVLPAWRNQGLGQALVQLALKAAAELGLNRIELQVFEDNAPAIAFYQKLGFEIEGKFRRHARVGEQYRDALGMARLLEIAH
ncbi:GNAT family N-acetyltransferase [Parachitinimonas caeni]|uniref:GNAT family N-acetyltransferase n=1 Tax=Parachitinimonas caeni TaxID=3031301 RepID=A0ABT7E2Z9_9NEIS|nr:GNAT family N-acetyltransferase [Parachitinimonas caeni]MDK2125292.1 GNAT family N-acetyltransferase [Parachitinimonas caeni]